MFNKLILFLATGGYAGYCPVMPGTVGTLWGIPLLLLMARFSLVVRGGALLLLTVIAVWLSSEAAKMLKEKDPSCIVIDEVIGFLVASLVIPVTALNIVFIFLLFRFFDIVKPFPVGLIDRKIGGGLGVVLDDVVAGLYGAVLFSLVALVLR